MSTTKRKRGKPIACDPARVSSSTANSAGSEKVARRLTKAELEAAEDEADAAAALRGLDLLRALKTNKVELCLELERQHQQLELELEIKSKRLELEGLKRRGAPKGLRSKTDDRPPAPNTAARAPMATRSDKRTHGRGSRPSPNESAAEALPERFRRLAGLWKAETAALSSPVAMAMHPAYQQIIGLGPPALPLILSELRRATDHWFWALKAITGVDPVEPTKRGRLVEMKRAWLDWGRQQGVLPEEHIH